MLGPSRSLLALSAGLLAAACGGTGTGERSVATSPDRTPGTVHTVQETTLVRSLDASGVAEPFAQATLSTKLMGTVTAVLVREGDVVAAGQPLVRIDARDVVAREAQATASVAEAEAVYRDATTQAARIRSLYADSVATRAQLDAVETAVARAEAGVRAARAASVEVGVMSDYAVIRAPFAGTITRRLVDPGAFAAPGAPLVTIQDGARLRITVSAPPDGVRGIRRGDTVRARIEDAPARAVIEGIVPAESGNLYAVNALVDNRARQFLPGSAAALSLPQGEGRAIVVPAAALVREGDLIGVTLRLPERDERRWVRVGRADGAAVEILSGLRAGDQIVIPQTQPEGK